MRWLIYAALLFLLLKIVIKASSDARGRSARMRSPAPKPGLNGPGLNGAGLDGPGLDSSKRSPHEVLGVDVDASEEEVRRAYQSKMREYHPDRVANAAAELRELAEKRSKEINVAYDALRRGRSEKEPR